MELERYINCEFFSLEKIARELYDFSKLGVLSIPNFLTQDFCRIALEDFKRKEYLFKNAPLIEGETRQELKIFYCGEADKGQDIKEFPILLKLRAEYSPLYKRIRERAKFNQGAIINSVGIHHYFSGSIGMGFHRDYSRDINLVSIFVLKGDAPFYVSKNKKGNGKLEIFSEPGSIILMRGPRNDEENEYRPYHAVGNISEERYSIIFRQKRMNGAAPFNSYSK